MGKKITSEERTNIFGDKYTVHYDEHGNKLGTSEKRKNIFGDEYVAHYDKNSNKTGTSENRTNIFGDKYTAHYDKNSNRTGTSENRTNIFGDDYVAHYDNNGNKVGESYQRSDIFGNNYSEYYGNSSSSSYGYGSSSNSNYSSGINYDSTYNSTYTQPVSKPKEVYKRTGGGDSVPYETFKKLNSVKLSEEMYNAFAWYSAGLLKNKKIPFNDYVDGAGLWKIKTYSECYESANHYKDEDTTTYLCEHGFAWEIEAHHGSECGTYECYSEEKKVDEPLIDYLLSKNNIPFSSRDFTNMPSDMKDKILAEYEKCKVEIEAGRKAIATNRRIKSIRKSPDNYQNSDRNPVGPAIVIIGWIVLSAVMLASIYPSYATASVLSIIGIWLVSRFKEYSKYTIAMSGFIFACAAGMWAFDNPTLAVVMNTIVSIIVLFICWDRVGPYYNLKHTEASKVAVINVIVTEILAILNLPVVRRLISNENTSANLINSIYIVLALFGLASLVGFIIYICKLATNMEKKMMVRSHLWCLLFGLIPPVFMLVFKFIPPLINLGITIIALLAINIIKINKTSHPKMASKFVAFPTVFCLLLGLFSEYSGTYALEKIFMNFHCKFILDFLSGFGHLVSPISTIMFSPVTESINFVIEQGHGIPSEIEKYLHLFTVGRYLLAYIMVAIVCSIGAAIANKRNKSNIK